jgi:hypothetical protein
MPTGVYKRKPYSAERLAQIAALGKQHLRHGNSTGYAVTPTYQSWRSMIQRCTNPKRRNYKWYGGRGITVYNRWLDSFDNFFKDMGQRPAGKTLDRYPNPDGNYEPGNCRWATQREQIHNSRRYHNRVIAVRQL